MVLIMGDAAVQAAGMTKEHAHAFQEIADAFTCIIMSRSVNLDCTGLIAEGYASKGFKVKAKSCSWGPTAGFVVADPRLSKLGPSAKEAQKEDIAKAIKDGAGTTPIFISEQRLKYIMDKQEPSSQPELKKKLYSDSNLSSAFNSNQLPDSIGKGQFDCYAAVVYTVAEKDKDNKDIKNSFTFTLQFRLKREEVKLKSGKPTPMWAVYYAPGVEGVVWDDKGQYQEVKSTQEKLIPVRAMTNPTKIESHKGEENLEEYKKAVTGDYDLFAVLPVDASKLTDSERASLQDKCNFYDKNGWDLRHVKIGITKPEVALLKNEDKELGNITVRLRILMEGLNAKMQEFDGHKGRNMVHHSDEAGRPFEPELEFPVIAFVPTTLRNFFDFSKILPKANSSYLNSTIFGIPSAPELGNFFVATATKFAVMVNTSWRKALANMMKGDALLKGFEVPTWTDAERAQGDRFLIMKFKG